MTNKRRSCTYSMYVFSARTWKEATVMEQQSMCRMTLMDVVLMNRLVHSSTLTVHIGECWIIDVWGNIRIGDWIYCYMTVARTGGREDCGREQLL